MKADPPAIRIFPMSDKLAAFRGRTIQDVQRRLFLRELPRTGGRWEYQRTGLNAARGTLVLFQYRARVIASAVFLRDEKYDRPRRGFGGRLHFDPKSFCTFDPLDVAAMRTVWPNFRAFGHVKQYLNPTLHSTLKRRLKNVASPA